MRGGIRIHAVPAREPPSPVQVSEYMDGTRIGLVVCELVVPDQLSPLPVTEQLVALITSHDMVDVPPRDTSDGVARRICPPERVEVGGGVDTHWFVTGEQPLGPQSAIIVVTVQFGDRFFHALPSQKLPAVVAQGWSAENSIHPTTASPHAQPESAPEE